MHLLKKNPKQQTTKPANKEHPTKKVPQTKQKQNDRNEPKPRNIQEKNVPILRCFAQRIEIL